MGIVEKLSGIPELVKLENTIFVLPFTYIGMLFAGTPTLIQFLLVTIALVCARGAAFSINRIVGHRFDASNPKKKNWNSLRLYTKAEMGIAAAAFAAVFMASAHMLNALAFVLAPVIVLLILLEPYTKRYTQHRHFTMGIVIGLGIMGGYIGVAGTFPTQLPLYVLLAGYALFSGANDIIYTINHIESDIANRLKTYPVSYGSDSALSYSYQAHAFAAVLFAVFGYLNNSALLVLAALVVFGVLYLEHRQLRSRDERSLKVSFFYYNAAVSLLLLAFFIAFRFF